MCARRSCEPLSLLLVILFIAVAAGGCTSSPKDSGGNLVDAQGNHPAAFLTMHPSTAVSSANDCMQCHGADLAGGIAKVSCFGNTANCHHGTKPGWASSAVHGAQAKKGPDSSSFSSCRICHGADFSGGGSKVSCLNNSLCHGAGVISPHPAKPWRASSGATHTSTDPANAPVCAGCHFPGSASNPANHPATPAPAGTPPGCFNNTLCHGQEAAPHAVGAGWRDPAVGGSNFHGLSAKQDLSSCQACHGTPGTIRFDGGAASTSCSTASCHPQAHAHPIPWFAAPQPFPGYVSSHRNSGNRSVACAICHKVDGAGTGPDPAAPSCFTASRNGTTCHANGPGNAPHAVPFPSHTNVTQATFADPFPVGCSACHAESGASPLSSAPSCTTCHQGGSPLSKANCTSCHARPPAGSIYPDIPGNHGKHNALAGVTGVCTSCHNGLDTGTLGHYDRANARPGKDALRVPPGDAAFQSKYNGKAGSASFNSAAFTCSNVSCHGGKTTPNWRTGTIAVNTNAGCLQCHALGTAQGTPEANSPFSGLHDKHLNGLGAMGNALCTDCHAMGNGTAGATNHFLFLGTPQLEGPASQTVTFPGLTGAAYDSANQTCTLTCHTRSHSAFSWSGGGASHAVPFLNPTHTTVTQTAFNGSCNACHAESGTSPISSAPTCQTCHTNTAVSPLTTKNCSSCHAKPPAGGAYPNLAGRHAAHNALAGIANVCTPCHDTFDAGTQAHYDRANARPGMNALRVSPGDTKFLSTFNAKSGVASFGTSTFVCSNASCHGGILTPRWDTGTIDAASDAGCKQCHLLGTALGTPENNSPFSGRHTKHVTGLGAKGNAGCPECHNMGNGTQGATNHFRFLDTPQMEGPASQTVEPMGVAGNYNAASQTCGTFTCHTQLHTGFSWTGGGASHSIPYLDAAHTTVTQTGFNGNCAACHAESGTSPLSSAPTCQVCHTNTAVSPLTVKNCTSCHADPPGGTAYPNIAGRHTVHLGLNTTNTPVSCNTCHNGIGSGTQGHYDRVKVQVQPGDVLFLAAYNARTGASSFSSTAFTCGNVSCHGGQTTPSFRTGTINVDTQCTLCHQQGTGPGTPQYNVYWSGEHGRGQHVSAGCTACHNTTKLADPATGRHFLALSTTAMEVRGSLTIGGGTTDVTTYTSGGTVGTGSCTPRSGAGCHGTQNW